MTFGIDRFVGKWRNAEGFRLEIGRIDATHAVAALFSPFGPPVSRPYYDGRPTVEMPAIYHGYEGDMEIELWQERSGFVIQLEHENSYELDPSLREALVPALCQYAEDTFFNEHHGLFGRLSHFVREEAEPSAAGGPGTAGASPAH